MEITHHKESESSNGWADTVREAVFGLEDGIVSTLGALVGIAIGTQDRFVVVLSGLVIIAVESLSMAAGSYLSSKSEREVTERYLEEERWEIENRPDHEREELYGYYAARGFTREEAEILVRRVTSDPKMWLEEMAQYELKIIPEEAINPRRNALVMGMCYIIGGFIPLVSYLTLSVERALPLSIGLSVSGLFLIGALITRLTKRVWWKSGLEMVVVSVSAAAIGYVIGSIAQSLFPQLQ